MYIAKVYENKDANKGANGFVGYNMRELKEHLITDCRHIDENAADGELYFKKKVGVSFDRIGLYVPF